MERRTTSAALRGLAAALLAAALGVADPAAGTAAGAPPAPGAEGPAGSQVSAEPAEKAPAVRSRVEEAWLAGGPHLARRANEARRRALEVGDANVEAAARALLRAEAADPSAGLSRALLAVRLAPDLPKARVALARAHWRDGDPRSALVEAGRGLLALGRHVEASTWLAASVLAMVVLVVVGASLAFVTGVFLSFFSHAAHDLSDLVSRRAPSFAGGALLGSLLMVPLLLGEGVLGLTLVALAVGFAYGRPQHRRPLALAAVLLVLGMYPMVRIAGTALDALDADPVAAAALTVVRGIASPPEIERLEAVADEDALAAHALAAQARRLGRDDEALARYRALHERLPGDAVVSANLAGLLFRRGETEAALSLYEQAAARRPSATLLFDLSQAYARSFRMEDVERALARAQRRDSDRVAELSRMEDPLFVADLPFPVSSLRWRLVESASGEAFARALSRPLAPGWLGGAWWHSALGLALAALAGLWVGGRYEHSGRCQRCGTRVCARCDGNVFRRDLCDGCHRLFHRPESTDPTLRMARLQALRAREDRGNRVALVACLAVPGAGGLLARRPDLAFLGLLFAGFAAAAVVWRDGVVPDPLAVGDAGSLAFLLAASLALAGYLAVALGSWLVRRSL